MKHSSKTDKQVTDAQPDVDPDLLIDTIPNGLIVLDAGCRIRRWNRAMETLTGYSEKEVLGKPSALLKFRDTQSGQPLDSEQQCLANSQPNVARLKEIDCTLQSKTGIAVPVNRTGRVIQDIHGTPIGILEILTDLRPMRELEEKLLTIQSSPPEDGFASLVGRSHAMNEVYNRIQLACNSEVTVLIEGETGTGKELVAAAIHENGERKDKPLIKVNCSALSENLLESELFGHVKGAFTGAIKDKVGRIEMAEGGTLLLDEIGDISPLIQLKLLRVLQEHEYERVGDSTPRKANVRFIAATHRDLKQRIAGGLFREDFFYRIRVFSIAVPPLREHKKDLPLLCNSFIQKLNQRTDKHITHLSHAANHCLMDYCWPGNVRELENAIEHAFVTCANDCIELDDLPLEIRTARQRSIECRQLEEPRPLPITSPTPITQQTLLSTLQKCQWNQSEAARQLGVNRTTIWRKMKQLKISLPGTTLTTHSK